MSHPKHEKIYQEHQDKKIAGLKKEITDLLANNKELREKNLGQIGMLNRQAFDIRGLEAKLSAAKHLNASQSANFGKTITLNNTLEGMVQKQSDYIRELESRTIVHDKELLRKLQAAEMLNASQGQYVIELHKEMDNYQKRFLACWDELQVEKKETKDEAYIAIGWRKAAEESLVIIRELRADLEASKKAAATIEDMLKTKSTVCSELVKTIARLEKELNVLEKEKEMQS